jgi:prepilin peptidase CpaA
LGHGEHSMRILLASAHRSLPVTICQSAYLNLFGVKTQILDVFIMDIFAAIFLSGVLIVSAAIDFRVQKIPNLITYPAMASAISYYWFLRGLDGVLFSLGGMAAGIGLLLLPYLMGGMGAGDAKLMGAVGGITGAKGALMAFVLTAIVGGVYALILILIYRQHFRGFFEKQVTTLKTLILTRKYIPDPVEVHNKKPKLCYGLAIAIGTGLYIILNLSGFKLLG